MAEQNVSIIVPVYNVAAYMDQCIASILAQTYKTIEIILVDDGSTDNSGEKCEEWAKKDERISVIHKHNAGLGYARNSGLDVATGEYVMFIDSDDFVAPDMVEKLMNRIDKHQADAVYCSMYRYLDDKHITRRIQMYSNEVFYDNDIVRKVLLEKVAALPEESVDSRLSMSSCAGIYSMSLIKKHNIRFPSEREFISEDIIFHIDYLQQAACVAFIPDNLYYYRCNNASLSKRYNPLRFKQGIVLYKEIDRRLGVLLPRSEYIFRAQRLFLGHARSCIMRAALEKNASLYKETRMICYNAEVQAVLSEYPYTKNPLRQKLFNRFVYKKRILFVMLLAVIAARHSQKK